MTRFTKRDLVIFGDDWGRHASSTQYLAKYLAHDRRILWVNSLGLRQPRLSLQDASRIWGKLQSLTTRNNNNTAAVPANMHILEPLALPFHHIKAARQMNRHLLRHQLQRAMAKAGITNPILWVTTPSGALALDQMDAHALVYYCADDFSAWPGTDASIVQHFEQQLHARADLVFAVSTALQRRFGDRRTCLLPHGVDQSLFGKPAEPSALLDPTRPTAGFYGSTFDRLDMAMLRDAASCLPEWEFLFVGKVDADISPLADLPNCRFTGPVPAAELPGLAQFWTASLLPFRQSKAVMASNPLKLREYFAAGRPVISTDMPALDGYRDLLHVARDASSLVQALKAVRKEDNQQATARQQRVSTESWQARAALADQQLALLG